MADDYEYLIYDKASESGNSHDHGYSNKLTKEYSIQNLFGIYDGVEGELAIKEFNNLGTKFPVPSDLLSSKIYHAYYFEFKNQNNITIKIMVIGVNHKLLEEYVINKQKIDNSTFLLQLCNFNIMYENERMGKNDLDDTMLSLQKKINDVSTEITKSAMTPNADVTDLMEEQPTFAKVKLFDYQKRTIKWMSDKEINPKTMYYGTKNESIIGNVVYDNTKHDFILASSRPKFTFCGGGLIDEVGLGKTYQMIITSLHNQAKNINYYQKEYKKLFAKGTLVVCPNQLAGQWVRELEKTIEDTYNLSVLPLFTKIHFDKYTYQDLLDADFVITSYTFLNNPCFLNQWLTKLSSQKSFLTSTKYDHPSAVKIIDELSEEIKNDVSKLYTKSPNILFLHWHRIVVDEFHEIETVAKYKHMKNILKLFNGNYKWVMTATPFDKSEKCLISMFDFVTNYTNKLDNRILLDENISTYLNKNFFRRNTKKSVVSEYQLPPIKETIIKLSFTKTEWMMYNAYIANPNVDKYSVLVRQICCHPKIAEEIKSALANCKTLEDVEKMMVKHYEKDVKFASDKVKLFNYKIANLTRIIKIKKWKQYVKLLKRKHYNVHVKFTDKKPIKEVDAKIEEVEQEINEDLINDDVDNPFNLIEDEEEFHSEYEEIVLSNDTEEEIKKILRKELSDQREQLKIFEDLNDLMNIYINKLQDAKKIYDGKKTTLDYYNNVMNKLKKTHIIEEVKDVDSDDSSSEEDENEKCGVCMGNITGYDLGVTKCGHIFCYNCVKPFVEKKANCPLCQKHVTLSEIYKIDKPMPKEEIDSDFKDKQSLISRVGTKLGNLIFFLKKSNKHTIIFSQWDDLLRNVGDVLNEYGIKNVFCKGNVWQRDKALREFNTNDAVKVIMLSSESAASGTNLTKAGQVILLDPVVGTYEYRRNTEWQAIGRAYRMGQTKEVEVVRIIINNTVEDEIYTANKTEDAKCNINQKIFEFDDDNIKLDQADVDDLVKSYKDAEKTPKRKMGSIAKKESKTVKKQEINEDLIEEEDSDE